MGAVAAVAAEGQGKEGPAARQAAAVAATIEEEDEYAAVER